MRIFKVSKLRIMMVCAGISVAMVGQDCSALTGPTSGKGASQLTSLNSGHVPGSAPATAPSV